MRVLLIASYFPKEKTHKGPVPPLGVYYIASMLETGDHQVKIIDLMTSDQPLQDVESAVRSFKPDMVGISFATANRFMGFEIAKKIKEVDSSIPVIAGGVHVTFTAEDTLQNVKDIDVVAIREGEYTMLELANGVPWEEIKGIAFRKNDKIVITPPRPPVTLDELPLPAYHLMDIEKYDFPMPLWDKGNYRQNVLITMRGCPYKCNFCSISAFSGSFPRKMSIDKVIDNIRLLVEKYRTNAIYILDENFSLYRHRAYELCQRIIDEKFDIQWYTDVRVNEVTDEMFTLMKKAGCYGVSFGVESANEDILKIVGKRITLQQVHDCIDLCKKNTIKSTAYFIYGLPGETAEHVKRTHAFIKTLDVNRVGIGIARIYPGTELETIAKNTGCLPKDFSWAKPYYEPYHLVFASEDTVPLFEQPHLKKDMLAKLHMQNFDVHRSSAPDKLKKGMRAFRSKDDIKALWAYGKNYMRLKVRAK